MNKHTNISERIIVESLEPSKVNETKRTFYNGNSTFESRIEESVVENAGEKKTFLNMV